MKNRPIENDPLPANPRPTVGILFPGEMGASLGRLLASNGFPVVTTLDGRSDTTASQCREAGLKALDTLEDLAATADIVISLVPPAAACEVAERYAACCQPGGRRSIFVEANSIAPATTAEIERLFDNRPVSFVDASIHGQAARLREQGTLYVSGHDAQAIAELFRDSLRVQWLGDEPGTASMFKMLMGGMSKGLVSLFLEISLVARESGLLGEMLVACRQYYPGVMTAIDRMLPTYPKHAPRRADEMAELERTVLSLGLRPGAISEARRMLTALGRSDLAERHQQQAFESNDLADIVELIHEDNPLLPSGKRRRPTTVPR